MMMSKQLPLIVVLGATACGKSKLAIELACRFGGEIISADSMQVYRGLDIVTNKVSEIELMQAKHHMLSFVEPNQNFSVVDFRNKSLEIIDHLQKKSRLPIVVGGTNYYIESLIWRRFILDSTTSSVQGKLQDDEIAEDVVESKPETVIDLETKMFKKLPEESLHSDEDLLDVDKFFAKKIYPSSSFINVESEKLWQILEQVDPETAHLCHPNNRRGIIRFLQIIQEKGKKYSDILKDLNKSEQEGKASVGGPLRYENTCVLWLNCENDILDKVVDERIDKMLDKGLVAELERFHEAFNQQRVRNDEKPDYNKGVFQTIGFKEFHDYLMLESEVKDSDKGKEILKKSIEKMKLSTRQYIRRQIKWIRSRFLRKGIRDLPEVFKLTTTFDEIDWQKQVRDPAFDIVENLISGRQLCDRLLVLREEPTEEFVAYAPGKYHCDACDRTLIGNNNINDHLRSKRHHNNLRFKRTKRQRLLSQIEAEIREGPENCDEIHDKTDHT